MKARLLKFEFPQAKSPEEFQRLAQEVVIAAMEYVVVEAEMQLSADMLDSERQQAVIKALDDTENFLRAVTEVVQVIAPGATASIEERDVEMESVPPGTTIH